MQNISQFEPNCTDNMAVIEKQIIEEYQKIMQRAYVEEFERLQNDVIESFNHNNWFCRKCKVKLYKHTPYLVNILTKVGEVTLSIKRYRCKSCKTIKIPAKDLIPPRNISANLLEVLCGFVSVESFATISKMIELSIGLQIPAKTIHNAINSEADDMIDNIEKGSQVLFDKMNSNDIKHKIYLDNPTMIIGIDGGWYNKHRQKGKQEAKTINVSTGAAPVGNNRYELVNRCGYSKNCDIKEFERLAYTFAYQQGLESAENVIVLSDGETYIRNLVKRSFPNALHILDLFHLKRKVNNTFGMKNTDKRTKTLRKSAIKCINDIDVGKLLEIITSWEPIDKDKQKHKKELITYVTRNLKQIENHLKVNIHGSGQIEKGVDLIVSRRLKMRAMGWGERGSNNMLRYRTMLYNKNWDDYWNKRKGVDYIKCA